MRITFSVVGNSPAMARLSNREIIVPGLPSLSKLNLFNSDSDMAMLNNSISVIFFETGRGAEAIKHWTVQREEESEDTLWISIDIAAATPGFLHTV
jgi:hypothetical protein